MRRGTQFFTGVVAALITFATLHFTLGPRHYGYWGHHRYAYGHYRHHDDCNDAHQHHQQKVPADSTRNAY